MALTQNCGNAVGLIKSVTPPEKLYVIWGQIIDEEFPDIVVHKVWNGSAWVLLGASDGSPIGGPTGGTPYSSLFIDGSGNLAQDNANYSYQPGVAFLLNTPSYFATNSSNPMAIVNDPVDYFTNPFAGIKYVDVSWSSYAGIVYDTQPYVNFETQDLSTGSYGNISIYSDSLSLSVIDGTNSINSQYTVATPQLYTFVSNSTISTSVDHRHNVYEVYINGATDTKLTQTVTGLTFIPGVSTAVSVFAIRNTGNTNDLFKIDGDGGTVFRNNAGSICFQIGSDCRFALGQNISMANVTNNDVIIGAGCLFGTVGGGRIAIGNGATVANSSTGHYSIAMGQGSSVLPDGGIGIGFASNLNGSAQGSVALGFNMGSTASSNVMIGTNYGNPQKNNIANSFMLQLGLAGASGNYQDFFISGKSNVVLRNGTQLTTGTHYETAATNTFTIHNGTNPTGVIADAIQISSRDTTEGTPKSTLALFLETVVTDDVALASTHAVRIWLNGTEYKLALTAV